MVPGNSEKQEFVGGVRTLSSANFPTSGTILVDAIDAANLLLPQSAVGRKAYVCISTPGGHSVSKTNEVSVKGSTIILNPAKSSCGEKEKKRDGQQNFSTPCATMDPASTILLHYGEATKALADVKDNVVLQCEIWVLAQPVPQLVASGRVDVSSIIDNARKSSRKTSEPQKMRVPLSDPKQNRPENACLNIEVAFVPPLRWPVRCGMSAISHALQLRDTAATLLCSNSRSVVEKATQLSQRYLQTALSAAFKHRGKVLTMGSVAVGAAACLLGLGLAMGAMCLLFSLLTFPLWIVPVTLCFFFTAPIWLPFAALCIGTLFILSLLGFLMVLSSPMLRSHLKTWCYSILLCSVGEMIFFNQAGMQKVAA